MEDSKALLHHYKIDPSGGATVTPADTPATGNGFLWMHVNGRHAESRKVLKDQLRLDPLVVKNLLADETRPRLDVFGEHALLILRGIHHNPGPDPEDLVSVRVWAGRNIVVSVGRRRSRAIEELSARIGEGRGPKTAGEFVSMLVSVLQDGIDPAIRELEDAVDDLEQRSLGDAGNGLREEIAALRKRAIVFRRHIAPQRDVIQRLNHARPQWIHDADHRYMHDSADRALRTVEDLDAMRERTQVVQDELAAAASSRLNRNIYALSVITVIFMPLTFLTGLLGANVAGIPAAGHPLAFPAFCALLGIVALAEIIILRRLKWF